MKICYNIEDELINCRKLVSYETSKEGDFITIQSYKHDGNLHRTWRDTMVLKTAENAIIGVNDHTLVTESDGRRWVTREPAIVYFHKNTGLISLP